jgi:uncharacterized protein YggL (DUF469 family)
MYVLRRDAPFSGDERAPDDRGTMSAPCPILGFTVLIDLHESVEEPQGEALAHALMELLSTQGLAASGGGRRQLLFVVSREGSQATGADRELVESWATSWSSVAAITVSDLVDLSPAS